MATEIPGTDAVSIHAASKLLSIPAPTIRSWESRYGVGKPTRTSGGHRRYSRAELADLRLMRDEISRGRRPTEAAMLVREAADPAAPYRFFVQAFLDVAQSSDTRRLTLLLDLCHYRFGIDEAVSSVVLPGMAQVGLAWQAGRCDTAQEREVTRATRGWLKKVFGSAPAPSRPGLILLSCGPQDLHTVGLETMAVLLAHRGWSCRLLGERVSAPELAAVIGRTDAAATIVVSQITTSRRATVEALRLADASPTQVFYAGDAFLASAGRKNVPGTYLGEDLLSAIDVVATAMTQAQTS